MASSIPTTHLPFHVQAFHFNPYIVLAKTRKGGHCGFLGPSVYAVETWADQVLIEWLEACLEAHHEQQHEEMRRAALIEDLAARGAHQLLEQPLASGREQHHLLPKLASGVARRKHFAPASPGQGGA